MSETLRMWLKLLPRSTAEQEEYVACDIHTHAHAQDSVQNISAEEMGTAGSL